MKQAVLATFGALNTLFSGCPIEKAIQVKGRTGLSQYLPEFLYSFPYTKRQRAGNSPRPPADCLSLPVNPASM